MTSRHEKLQELYWAAEPLAPEARAELLARQCPDDELRTEVEALLRSGGDAASFLETPAPLEHEEWLNEVIGGQPVMEQPRELGNYRILRVLGEGGMGVVYLAEQQAPRRTVALKVLKPWAPGSDALQRFEFEAELLGRLQHPGIAQIFEAGTADEGDGPRAFFAMEYIEGKSLLDYARPRLAPGLDRRRRIELVIRICDAVQHAHERGIVHRDLKPANIIVDGTGQPKVLDFGVARATTDVQVDGDDGRVELFGTLPYMSPEQLKGDSSLVDTRADEYALGVILYQLLSDRLPIPYEGRTPSGMMLSVLQDEPQRLGTIDPTLAGDLEAIAMKALSKDADDRYGSPAGLAADLRRYLEKRPVLARPATRLYTAVRFLQRNAVPVTAVASVILALATGIVIALIQAGEARAQANRSSGLLSFFLDDVLSAADPMDTGERDVQFSTVLEDAVERARERFRDRPADLATILQDVAASYKNLTRHEESKGLLEEALRIRRDIGGDDDEATLRAQNQLAMVERDLGQWDEAEARLEGALAAAKSLGDDTYEVLISKHNLAVLAKDKGRLDVEDLYIEVMEGHERLDGPLHVKTLLAKSNLAMLYLDTGRVREGIPLMEEVLEGHLETLDAELPEGRHHPETLISMDILGGMYLQVGELDRARDLIGEAVEGLEQQLGQDHDDVMAAQYRLGKLLVDLGELDEAIAVDRRAFDAALRVHGEEHRSTIFLMGELGRALRENGDLDEAEERLVRCVELCREVFPENHPSLVWRLAELARLHLALDDHETARATIEESLAAAATHYEADDWRLGTLNLEHGRTLTRLERYGEAERELLRARELIEGEHGPRHRAMVPVFRALAELYEATGQDERLAEIRAAAPAD